MTSIEVDPDGYARKLRKNPDSESSSFHVEMHDEQFDELHASAQRRRSHIGALSQQLCSSQAELESTSARFTELAGEIPADIAGLSDRLSRILNAAAADAEETRAEARQFAATVQIEAEERAARIISEAQLEYDSATSLRADLETQSKQMRVDIARLREQAALNAADIVREAEEAAEEMLTSVQRDIDGQLMQAQAKLDELIGVRAQIATQLRDFYEKFNQLDGSMAPIQHVQVTRLASSSSNTRPSYGTHAAAEVHLADGAIHKIG
ncbi:V-type ATP synthase subunit E family protein [Mycobacterium triplex]|uniref:M protein n=1 Tax=Mycobacterium triplex TaxID=47839 RepID=A0A024JVG2_9MYCO|nr:M protein [Mycobacterium triplex]CDO87616.1 M protein [Mycobacterium triplex]